MNKSRRCMYKFFDTAERAVAAGLITMDDAHAIWDRKGKRRYWCRHLRDLKALVELARLHRREDALYAWHAQLAQR